MSRVWDASTRDSGEFIVELALADACNDDGECWMKHDTLARKARMSERQARRIISSLIEAGVIEKASAPSRLRNCNTYRFPVAPSGTPIEPMATSGHPDRPPMASPSNNEPLYEPSCERAPTLVDTKSPRFIAIKEFLFDLEGIPFPQRRPEDYGRMTDKTKSILASDPNATLEEVKRRAENYRKKWPRASLTANALAKHYPSLGDVTTPSTSTSDSIPHY